MGAWLKESSIPVAAERERIVSVRNGSGEKQSPMNEGPGANRWPGARSTCDVPRAPSAISQMRGAGDKGGFIAN